jgi:hypothetical protein
MRNTPTVASVGGPVFLTAPRGILGAFLVRELLSRGAPEVRCGVRDPSAASQLESIGAVPVRFDLEDSATFRAALAGIETLVIVPPVQVEDLDKGMWDGSSCLVLLVHSLLSQSHTRLLSFLAFRILYRVFLF